MPEGPARLVKQLTQIGLGLAMVAGKPGIDLEVYETIKKIGRDLVSSMRISTLRYLYDQRTFESGAEWETTTEIAAGINKPTNTTLRMLEDLMIVGALRRQRQGGFEKTPYLWQLRDDFLRFVTRAEVFEDSI